MRIWPANVTATVPETSPSQQVIEDEHQIPPSPVHLSASELLDDRDLIAGGVEISTLSERSVSLTRERGTDKDSLPTGLPPSANAASGSTVGPSGLRSWADVDIRRVKRARGLLPDSGLALLAFDLSRTSPLPVHRSSSSPPLGSKLITGA